MSWGLAMQRETTMHCDGRDGEGNLHHHAFPSPLKKAVPEARRFREYIQARILSSGAKPGITQVQFYSEKRGRLTSALFGLPAKLPSGGAA